MKKKFKINEAQLKQIVAKSMIKVLKENYADEEFIGDDLQTIKDTITSIKEKISRGNLAGAGYDPTTDGFLSSKIKEMDEIIDELLSDSWH